jgi:high-affinity iron transporter
VLILAAITASMVGLRARLRRPVFIGALGGLLVSVFTWVLAQTILRSLDRYGEKLEAVVGLIAIAVLLLITNWFFHKVYWSEWIGKFHRQRKRFERLGTTGFISGQVLGMFVLGLTSVYREGFETVLFLQSYLARPMQVFGLGGLVLSLTGFCISAWLTIDKLVFGAQLSNRPLLTLGVIMVLVGVQLLSLGLVADVVGRTYHAAPYWSGLWFASTRR